MSYINLSNQASVILNSIKLQAKKILKITSYLTSKILYVTENNLFHNLFQVYKISISKASFFMSMKLDFFQKNHFIILKVMLTKNYLDFYKEPVVARDP